jgi:ferritin-like metal-binding protein YciE
MANAKELFITGLKNAHSMERNAQEMLERQVERLDQYLELKSKLGSHLAETKAQLSRLEKCLSECGSSPSTIKDTIQSVGANMAAVGHAMADDEVLKNTFANSALEHYEIAAYMSLLARAVQAATPASKTLLEESLREEQQMADWIDQHVEPVTLDYLRHELRSVA